MIRVIVIKSAFITKNSKIELFEGTIDQFEKYIIDNFANWFNGYTDSCKSVAHTVIKDGNYEHPIYVGEIAAWFQLIH
jgi:hypothetical protein